MKILPAIGDAGNPRAVRHDDTEIAQLRNIDTRIVDLVEDAAPHGEPDLRRTQAGAHHLFGALAPVGGKPRCARGLVGDVHVPIPFEDRSAQAPDLRQQPVYTYRRE